jgi:enoyl-[acyl-carrier protein] reductase II
MTGRKIIALIIFLGLLTPGFSIENDYSEETTAETIKIELADSLARDSIPDKNEFYKEMIRKNRIILIALPFFFAVILIGMIQIQKSNKKEKKIILEEMNKITELFNIKYPIIQAGMIWCSGWELAAAVSNAGGLGLIGSGSMYPDQLRENIQKCKKATDKPFGVNVPLLYPQTDEHIKIIIEEGVKIVFTSAGNPKKWTKHLQEHGIKVVHVIANTKFAKKCEEAGVDAIVAEGFEAGGHNGAEETTTMTLIPQIKAVTNLPLIAAGGIGTGRGMLAALVLGADGVQIGSRFVASDESTAHYNFKNSVIEAVDGSTKLTLKQVVPVRLIKNKFFNEVEEMEKKGASVEELKEHLGRGRAKKGMLEGDLENGELEIGQISGLIKEIKPAGEIVEEIIKEFEIAKKEISNIN